MKRDLLEKTLAEKRYQKKVMAIKDDMYGRKIGKLLVLRRHPSNPECWDYMCYCDCGREEVVNKSKLRRITMVQCSECERLENIQPS